MQCDDPVFIAGSLSSILINRGRNIYSVNINIVILIAYVLSWCWF